MLFSPIVRDLRKARALEQWSKAQRDARIEG